MTKPDKTNMATCGDVLAVEYFSFGIDHEGFICMVFNEGEGTLKTHLLDVHDETEEKVLQLLCKLADVHPVDLGSAAALVRQAREEQDGEE